MILFRNKRLLMQCCLYLAGVGCILYLFKSHASSNSHNIAHSFNVNTLHSNVLLQFILRLKQFVLFYFCQTKYSELCFEDGLKPSIANLDENLQSWSQAIDRKCQILYGKYQDLYSVSVRRGALHLPARFKGKVLKWMGGDHKLVSKVYNQTVFHVRNLYSLEHTVYNPLRAKRPSSGSSGRLDSKSYVSKLAASTNNSCDFCNFREMTAEDVFERIEGKHSVSAANAFKLDKWHGLILTKKHNPVDLNLEEVLDLFNTSLKWFHKVHSIDSSAKYPNLIWDSLPHAGASQVHPHIHTMMDPNQYYGSHHVQQEAARRYHQYTGNKYWDDLIQIHHALGLTVTLKSAVAVAPLTSKKDHELFILSGEPSVDFFSLLHQAVQTYYHDLSIYCFSAGLALPPAESMNLRSPAVVRMGTRGDCSSVHSDISSLELYSVNNVNVDPYRVIGALRKRVVNYLHSTDASVARKMVVWP
ncbi:Hypothetical predicted protein [Cloeon dipterum]|uniref:Uncharacterized protein n=1 Tax=Cloeon dipterum TaxID=197152 RepID=A0A8S1C8Y6_9INSE|nr:Hypothetical predicted protein [Cloeon dipterum]